MKQIKVLAAALAGLGAVAAVAQERPDPAALYQQLCATCHGVNLEGGNAQSMLDGVWQFGPGTGDLVRIIEHGMTDLGMPAYESVLEDAEIKALAQYILDAEKREGVVRPAPPEHLQTLDYEIDVDVWQDGLEIPWSIDFIDADTALVTERPGRLRIIRDGKLDPNPVQGTPTVLHEGQGGLFDVAVDPEYQENGWLYLAYAHALDPVDGTVPAMTRLVRGKVSEGRWTQEQVLFQAQPETYASTRIHFGGKIAFDKAGFLYFCTGERGQMEKAQDLTLPNGKIHRIHRDGSIPPDNPFLGVPGALPSIWSYGHRNPQGLTVSPVTDAVWSTEHGPLGGDEVNLIRGSVNYGWPVITYGRDYSGVPVSELTEMPGMAQPSLYWRPSIAASGLDFYHGDQFPKWNNRLLAGGLKYEEVRLLNVQNDRIIHQEIILKGAGRVRDVKCGPDGAIYVLLNSPDLVLKLTCDRERDYL